MIAYLALLISVAEATSDSVTSTRVIFPALTTSLQDDATTLWTNPSNFSFSPSLTNAVAIKKQNDLTSFAFAKQIGILGYGVFYTKTPTYGTWWSASSALAIKLDKNLSISTTSTWHSVETLDDNFVRWDTGVSWRPLQWLGFAGALNNIGSSQTSLTPERLIVGTGMSFVNNRLQLALDYVTSTTTLEQLGLFQGTMRFTPLKGINVQVQANDQRDVGVGLQFGYGLGQLGGFAKASNLSEYTLVHTRGIQDTSALKSGRKIAAFVLDGGIPYQSEGGLFSSSQETYMSFLSRLHKAANDPGIKGLYIRIESLNLSTAQIEEIRQELLKARDLGKKVIIYAQGSVGNGEYYLASAASELLAHPSGSIELIGLHSERIYLNELLNEVGVEPEFVKRAEYKSSPEQYTHREGSAASKEQTSLLLDDVFNHMTKEIAQNRGIPFETVHTLIDNAPFSNEQALKKDLVDQLLYEDELEEFLEEEFGTFLWMEDNYGYTRPDGWESNPEIAIIQITGVIMGGESQSPGLLGGGYTAGSKTIVGQINEAKDDDAVKAIVLRVDSPGGSAFASDQIWRAVTQAKEEKPIIVSMGGVAASGGYYVAAAADAIFAEETTITGSIGVYSGKFNANTLMQYLKINVEKEDRGKHASLYSTFDGWSDSERAKMEEQVEITYQQFKSIVSDGRGLDLEAVEEVARGRVWSGTSAKNVGLVDTNGGLIEVIEYVS
jgi:protease-4